MPEVVNLFESESPRIFRKRPFCWPLIQSRYSTEPIEQVVRSCVPDLTLGQIPTPLIITSSNIATGGVHVFKSRYLADLGEPYVRDGRTLLSDAILASCAAPTYFDPVQTGENLLVDGGLWANNPSIIALIEAVSKFKKSIEQVNILSIGTGHSVNLYGQNKLWGLITGWGRTKLVSYVLSLQSQASTNMAKLLLKDGYLRLDTEIENWSLDDTDHLGNLKALAVEDFTHQSKAIMANIRRAK